MRYLLIVFFIVEKGVLRFIERTLMIFSEEGKRKPVRLSLSFSDGY